MLFYIWQQPKMYFRLLKTDKNEEKVYLSDFKLVWTGINRFPDRGRLRHDFRIQGLGGEDRPRVGKQ